jgi:hypothetical protein
VAAGPLSRGWRAGGLRSLAVAFLLEVGALAALGGPAATHPELATEIDALFTADLKSGATETRRARVRRIFAEHGVPTDEMVGESAAEEYLVMLSGEPGAFLERVLPRLKRATDGGKISSNSYLYLQAEAHRRQIREKLTGPPQNPALQREIERLVKADQAVRPPGKPWDLEKLAAQDRADGLAVRAILAKYGLPTFALVGPQAAEDFDVVVQHQPLALRTEVLPQMKAAAEMGQIDPQNYAMLLDAVESGSGRPQTYGNKFVCTPDGNVAPTPIADAASVERRRAALGLMPLAVYGKVLAEGMGPFCAQIAAANRKAAAGKH